MLLPDADVPPHVLVLDQTLDLDAASALARTLAALRGMAVSVDPSQVARIGAQCAQVLIAARKTWAADGIAFAVTPGSGPFEEGMGLLGLASFFGKKA